MKILGPALALTLAATACSSGARPTPTTAEQATAATTLPTTTSTTVPTTTSTSQPAHDMALYRVDPDTLEPVPDLGPLTTGDWISGHLSPSGDWLAVHVWLDTDPETDLVQVIDTRTGQIVTETSGRLADFMEVGDDGSVYQLSHLRSSRLRRLAPGDTGYETVFDMPSDFVISGSSAVLDPGRAAWFGWFDGDVEEPVAGIVVADLTTGSATSHRLAGVTVGEVGETEVEDWTLLEAVAPAVVWDRAADRALIVHGDEEVTTIVDLTTGEQGSHEWSEATSWLGRLLAWLVPPAGAKGPSHYGISRSAALDPEGERLYVGTSVAEVVHGDSDWFVDSEPTGVVVIDTATWEIIDRLEVPVSEVTLSPDGSYLVGTGAYWAESLTRSHVAPEPVHVFDTTNHELLDRFDPPDAWPYVQFAPDGDFMYIGAFAGHAPNVIVDLDEMAEVGRRQGTLFGEVSLFATTRR